MGGAFSLFFLFLSFSFFAPLTSVDFKSQILWGFFGNETKCTMGMGWLCSTVYGAQHLMTPAGPIPAESTRFSSTP